MAVCAPLRTCINSGPAAPGRPPVLAADAAFARVLAERIAVVPRVPACRPGKFYRRELPPLRAVLDDLRGLGLLVVDGYADLGPCGRPPPAHGLPVPADRRPTPRRHPRARAGPLPASATNRQRD